MPCAERTAGSRRRRGLAFALLRMPCGAEQARGGAFVVEVAGADKPGACKVESWGLFDDNRDRIGVTSPVRGFNVFPPVDFGLTYAPSRCHFN